MLHPEIFTDIDHDAPRFAVGYACTWRKGTTNEPHLHQRAQLIYATSGSMKVMSDEGTWIVPPERAVWMPPNIKHSACALSDVEVRFLYINSQTKVDLPQNVTVVHVTSLMRECLLAFLSLPRLYDEDGVAPHLLSVMLSELVATPVMPLHLPQPQTSSLQEAAKLLQSQLANPPKLEVLADQIGYGVRSFERHFIAETGLTWRRWVQQARLMEAISRLSTGDTVGDVAHALGYEGPSAFVAMFKKATGVTPGKYFADPKRQNH
ncbi:MAG: helix-turn-helix transcriptional regulator [Rhizobiales bacterium]|nr:helix-turn-helix transcriptional regulator [Hyphomicrobiales bacterium]